MTSISAGAGLSASLQRNILALQQTQSQIDTVQKRLATGLRVNSALDNADSFFTARSLSNRATRLNALLDSIGVRASAVQEAGEAAESLNDLLTQAQAKAEAARAELSDTTQDARITGNRSLTNADDLVADIAGVDDGDKLVFSFVDTDGSISSGNTVTISSGESINDIINEINAFADSGASQVFQASLNSAGQLTIKTQDASRFEIDFQTSGSAANSQLASALGFGESFLTAYTDGTAATRTTVQSEPSITTIPLYDADTNEIATTSTSLVDLVATSSGSTGDIFDGDSGDAFYIAVNGGAAVEVSDDISTGTLQDILDGINNNGSLNAKISASFNTSTGELNIRSIDSEVTSIQFAVVEDDTGGGTASQIDLQALGIGTQTLSVAVDGSGSSSSESIILGPSAANLAALESDYDSIRTQIDGLVEDSEFETIRLLQGEDLVTIFNEDGTSSLTTEGQSFTVANLGVSEADFGSSNAISNAITEVANAITSVENYTASLSTDLGIIETRQTFTQDTIATLEAGADNLTVADENEEGAALLALQTRQLLGVTALSLASQSQQSTLRLF